MKIIFLCPILINTPFGKEILIMCDQIDQLFILECDENGNSRYFLRFIFLLKNKTLKATIHTFIDQSFNSYRN